MAINRFSLLEINRRALEENLSLIRERTGPGVRIMAVVKADAYGHGALEVAKHLQGMGVNAFGVQNLQEAVELREGGIGTDIFLLGGVWDGEEDEVIALDLIPFVFDLERARALSERALRRGKRVRVHLKVDTGMGRLGVMPEEVEGFIDALRDCPGVRLEGIASHLSTADLGDDYLEEQLRRFTEVKEKVEGMGLKLSYHVANSAATFLCPGAHFDMVRPGIALYGAHPSREFALRFPHPLRPVMTWKSTVLDLRTLPKGWGVSYGRTYVTQRRTTLAVVPVGYADGYPRALSGNAYVLIRGHRAPVVGRVTMDWIMVDVTGIEGVRKGDEVVLLGDGLPPEEVAAWAGTIPYEILCLASKRARRAFIYD